MVGKVLWKPLPFKSIPFTLQPCTWPIYLKNANKVLVLTLPALRNFGIIARC
jgi:hypothetical protein